MTMILFLRKFLNYRPILAKTQTMAMVMAMTTLTLTTTQQKTELKKLHTPFPGILTGYLCHFCCSRVVMGLR